ncbi:MAG: thiamine phosphate synthase, partial [Planctomycetota bacterium]
ELLRHADAVRSRLPSSTRLVVNDRVDVAAALGVDVHLGREDLPTWAARKILGRDVQIGRSTSGLAEAQQAIADGADLVGVGPMFASATKDKPPVGPASAGTVASAGIPHLAIGGVHLQNIDALCEHGVAGVAICRGVLEASDVAGVVHTIQSRFGLVTEDPSCL